MEIVIWLTVLGALSMIGARMFQGIATEFRVRRAIREVAALLEWTRWEAVRSGEALQVEFEPEKERVSVYREPNKDYEREEPDLLRRIDLRDQHPGVVFGSARETPRTSGCQTVDPEGIHLQDHSIRFLPTGSTDRSGSLYLLPADDLPDHRDRMAALSILLATGRIQLWRFDPWTESGCSPWGDWVPLY